MSAEQMELVFTPEHKITTREHGTLGYWYECSECGPRTGYESESARAGSIEGHLARFAGVSS